MPARNWFTIDEAAAQLGVSRHTLRLQLRVGKLAGEKVGRDWLVSGVEIARYRVASLGRNQGARPVEIAQPVDLTAAVAAGRFGAPRAVPKPGKARKSETIG